MGNVLRRVGEYSARKSSDWITMHAHLSTYLGMGAGFSCTICAYVSFNIHVHVCIKLELCTVDVSLFSYYLVLVILF